MKMGTAATCIRNVAYGVKISAAEDPDGNLRFKEVVRRGGYSVYRILPHEQSKKAELIARLLDLGALVEQDKNLIAFVLPATANSEALIDYILDGKRDGLWGAEDGYVFEETE